LSHPEYLFFAASAHGSCWHITAELNVWGRAPEPRGKKRRQAEAVDWRNLAAMLADWLN
jgi:hypothetical protein